MSRNAARCWNPYLAAVYDVGKSAGVGLSQFLHLSTISGAARGSTQFMFVGDITIYGTCRSLPASMLPRGLELNFLRGKLVMNAFAGCGWRAVDMFQRGKHYDWGHGEWAFAMYATAGHIGMLLANNFLLAILGDAYSNQVRAVNRCAVRRPDAPMRETQARNNGF